MVGRYRVGDLLQQHGLAGARRRDDQAALAEADRREDIHHAHGNFGVGGFKTDAPVREERREVLEMDRAPRLGRRLAVHCVDAAEGEETLLLFRIAHRSFNVIAGAQRKAPHLRRRGVDILGALQVVALGRAQEAVAVRQDFQHAAGDHGAAATQVAADDFKDDLVLAQRTGVFSIDVGQQLQQVGDLFFLQIGQVQVRQIFRDRRLIDLDNGAACVNGLRGTLLRHGLLAVRVRRRRGGARRQIGLVIVI